MENVAEEVNFKNFYFIFNDFKRKSEQPYEAHGQCR